MDKINLQDLLNKINEANKTDSTEGDIYSHIESNAFNLSPEAHSKAKEMVSASKSAGSYEYPRHLENIHAHLNKHGVSVDHPHMKALLSQAEDAREMNLDKARSRAGY